MLATMAAKPEKDFMNILKRDDKKSLTGIAVALLAITFTTCSPDRGDDEIPFVPFGTVVLNLNLPDYTSLRTDGGYKVLSSNVAGVQGVIIYRVNASTYRAFERNCSYQPNGACVTVDVHSSGLYMYDPCCGSTFNFSDGSPLGSPAWRPLRQYQISVLNSELTISDEIVQ